MFFMEHPKPLQHALLIKKWLPLIWAPCNLSVLKHEYKQHIYLILKRGLKISYLVAVIYSGDLTSHVQASWLAKMLSNGELKRNADTGTANQEFWGVRGKRSEEG